MSSMIGLSFWLAISVMLCFYMMSIVLTWMVTNGRFLFLPAIFRPSDYLMVAFGSARFSDRDHTILTFDIPPSSHAYRNGVMVFPGASRWPPRWAWNHIFEAAPVGAILALSFFWVNFSALISFNSVSISGPPFVFQSL